MDKHTTTEDSSWDKEKIDDKNRPTIPRNGIYTYTSEEDKYIEQDVETINSVPPHIDSFLKTNNTKLQEIYDDGINANEVGCLFLFCCEKENKMDVSFLCGDNIKNMIHEESWKSILSNSKGKKIYIVKDNNIEDNSNTMFIIYL